MQDLSLILVDEIWEELKKRYDSVLLVTLKSLDKNKEESQINYSGGKFTCIGLAKKAIDRIIISTREDDEKL